MDCGHGSARLHTLRSPALTRINTEYVAEVRLISFMGNILFKCPRTGMNVQHWLADEPQPDNPQCTYETVVCKACSRLHFINRSTGKLLGDQR
jgi:hypothetical protein